MSPDKKVNITSKEENVEMVRENFAFLSRKFAKGRNNNAIKKEKKRGAKTPFPIFAKYPIAKILTKIKASLSTKGSLISFMKQSNNKLFFGKKKRFNY